MFRFGVGFFFLCSSSSLYISLHYCLHGLVVCMKRDSPFDLQSLEDRFARLRSDVMSGKKKNSKKGGSPNSGSKPSVKAINVSGGVDSLNSASGDEVRPSVIQNEPSASDSIPSTDVVDNDKLDDGVLDDQLLPDTIVAPVKLDGSPSKVIFTLPPKSIPVHGAVEKEAEVRVATPPPVNVGKAPMSYAAMVQPTSEKTKINFRKLEATEVRDDVDIVLPKESVIEVNNRFQNTLVGYFLGKRLAYPVVEAYVKNNWTKYGLIRVMMNGNGFFFFKFNDKDGMNKVLEAGPWMIRSVPLLLNVWSPAMSLKKEEIKNIVVWIRLHDVPMAAYTEDGLSLLASKLGNPKMLDSYTHTMCLESWGRSNFARALIDISAEQDFKEELTMAIPDLEGEGYSKEKIRVEYEWQPPRCKSCCIFGHCDMQCPKNVKEVPKTMPMVDDDGFQEVKRKAKKSVVIQKQKQNLVYRPVSKPSDPNVGASTSKATTTNKYDLLNDYEDDLGPWAQKGSTFSMRGQPHVRDGIDDFDADVDEHIEIPEETSVH